MAGKTARELLAKALKRREELRIESEALDTLIDSYRKIADLREGESENLEQLNLWDARSRRAFQSAQVAGLLDAARRIILAERRPMKRGELVMRLEDRGFTLEGSDKNKVFGTNLWRSKQFRHVPRKGYWPVDVPLPKMPRSH